MNNYSNLLFDEPSCLEGIARIFDFSNGLGTYNTSDSPEEADFKAILSDYYAIGQDLEDSMKEFQNERRGK